MTKSVKRSKKARIRQWRESKRRQYSKNPERGRAASRRWRNNNLAQARAATTRWARHVARYNKPYVMWRRIRQRSLAAGIPFDLTVADVRAAFKKAGPRCPVLGVKWTTTGRYARSLDRLIPYLGYVRGNIAVISMRANQIKTDARAHEVESVARWMRAKGL